MEKRVPMIVARQKELLTKVFVLLTTCHDMCLINENQQNMNFTIQQTIKYLCKGG